MCGAWHEEWPFAANGKASPTRPRHPSRPRVLTSSFDDSIQKMRYRGLLIGVVATVFAMVGATVDAKWASGLTLAAVLVGFGGGGLFCVDYADYMKRTRSRL